MNTDKTRKEKQSATSVEEHNEADADAVAETEITDGREEADDKEDLEVEESCEDINKILNPRKRMVSFKSVQSDKPKKNLARMSAGGPMKKRSKKDDS